MQTPDFFRSRVDAMINLNDPLAVLASRLPWDQIEASVAAKFERQARAGQILEGRDMFGPTAGPGGCRSQQRGAAQVADSPDGQPAVPQAQLQSQRRRTGGALEREHRLAVFQRHGLLRTPTAVRCHTDRSLSPGSGRRRPDAGGAHLPWQPLRRSHSERGPGAGNESDAGHCRYAQTHRGRSGLSRRGRRQPGQGDHSQGQIQESEQAAKGLAQTANSGGARHWPLEVGSPHGSLLATRRVGRCLALHQLRRWLQPALAAARHCPSGHKGGIFAPAARCVVGKKGHSSVIRPTGPLRDSVPERLARQSDGCQSTPIWGHVVCGG